MLRTQLYFKGLHSSAVCSNELLGIDKQKALMCDCIYNIENLDGEIGVLGVYLHLLYYNILTHIDVPVRLAHFMHYNLHINLLK